MSEKAEVAEKYSKFSTSLLSRPMIVLGMGLRQFNRFFSKKHQYTMAIGLLLYLIILMQIIFIALLGQQYPCEYVNPELGGEKDCITMDYYTGFSKILLILIACMASSGLISNDLTNNSIHLYLSRPISRTDYLIARFMPIFMLLMLFTAFPNLLVYITVFFESGFELDWLKEHSWLFLNIILQGILYSFTFAIIGLTFSATINREAFAAGGFFLTIYGLLIIVEFANYIVENDLVFILSISHLLEIISYDIHNLDYYVLNRENERVLLDLHSFWIYGMFASIIGGCLAFLQWTIYQMEMTK